MHAADSARPRLLVIELEGAETIARTAAEAGWHPVFVETGRYSRWVPPPERMEGLEVVHAPNPSFHRLYELATETRARSVLAMSLLEDECKRDALLKDLVQAAGRGMRVVANSPSAVALIADKGLTKAVLRQAGVPVVPGGVVSTTAEALAAAEEVGYPALLKPCQGFAGQGIRLVRSAAELASAFSRHAGRSYVLEPFVDGVEIAVEIIAWKGRTVRQPLVYKGHTREDLFEHPAYRPRLSPWNKPPRLREKVVSLAEQVVDLLHLVGVVELEFVVVGEEPYLMEVNPGTAGISRLCSVASGIDTFALLAGVAIRDELREDAAEEEGLCLSLPIVRPPEGRALAFLRAHQAVRYVEPVSWMPLLPIKGNVVLRARAAADVPKLLADLEWLSAARYLDEVESGIREGGWDCEESS